MIGRYYRREVDILVPPTRVAELGRNAKDQRAHFEACSHARVADVIERRSRREVGMNERRARETVFHKNRELPVVDVAANVVERGAGSKAKRDRLGGKVQGAGCESVRM